MNYAVLLSGGVGSRVGEDRPKQYIEISGRPLFMFALEAILLAVDSPMEDVDVLIGIVGNWIDKPESVLQMVEVGKKVMLFFNAFQDPKNTIPSEMEIMEKFKERMQARCLCREYNGFSMLTQVLDEQLFQF